MFSIGEIAILNERANKGLPMRTGERVTVIDQIDSFNYDYQVEFYDNEKAFVRECELNKLSEEIKIYMSYIFTNNKVLYFFDEVTVGKCDYLHKKAEIKFNDESSLVVDFDKLHLISTKENSVEDIKLGYFEQLGLQIGKLVDKKQKAYGDSVTKCYKIMRVLLEDYRNEEEKTYTIPESLLPQMLLDIRKIDKMNRRFSNPDGDLMGENPYQDDTGYDMLGVRLVEQMNKDGFYD